MTDVNKAFTYQKPNQDQINTYFELREKGKELANLICSKCPQSIELTNAIDRLRECIMWANASIALNNSEES